MPKFEVVIMERRNYKLIVEANDEEEARETAYESDWDTAECDLVDSEVVWTEEITEEAKA